LGAEYSMWNSDGPRGFNTTSVPSAGNNNRKGLEPVKVSNDFLFSARERPGENRRGRSDWGRCDCALGW
jgi:hypothetical protein